MRRGAVRCVGVCGGQSFRSRISKGRARSPRIGSIDATLAFLVGNQRGFGAWTDRSTPTVCHPFDTRRNVNVTGISHAGKSGSVVRKATATYCAPFKTAAGVAERG